MHGESSTRRTAIQNEKTTKSTSFKLCSGIPVNLGLLTNLQKAGIQMQLYLEWFQLGSVLCIVWASKSRFVRRAHSPNLDCSQLIIVRQYHCSRSIDPRSRTVIHLNLSI
jgi:hypothetical protein